MGGEYGNVLYTRECNKIYLVLQDITNEEAEELGADLNAIQNLESRPHLHPSKFASPKSKKIHTSPPPSPHSPHIEPSSQPPSRPPTEQPLPTEWSTVQNKLMEALQKLCNRIEDNLAAPPPPSPSQAAPPPPPPPTTEAAPPPPSPPSQAAPPPSPPPTTEAAPPPPPSQAAPPPPTSQAAPPPPSQGAPPPPPPTSQAAPPPPTAEVQDAQALIKYQPHKKKRKRDDKKEIDTVEEKKTKQDVISVDRIEILPRVAEINLEYPGKIFLTTEQQTFMDECFKKFNKK
ncbi:hypothetical protein IEQ34_000751 [Dendrobium chrysotoxum]|uniref:Uncharacterized protein n=1 Tax=Dendrobium chrysotoxum TaxID=161865 RepID=A0AAV7HT51_DENCH|nr:hypothetical protein IEQ34_000751 [Dendrobium chrysotoxum]